MTKKITPAQMTRILHELDRGSVAMRALSLDKGPKNFPCVNGEALGNIDIHDASNIIDAINHNCVLLPKMVAGLGIVTESYAKAWSEAKQERIDRINAKNDLTKVV